MGKKNGISAIHNKLEDLISGILTTQNIKHDVSKKYVAGEMDIYCNTIYYEIKSSHNPASVEKATNQIRRAIRYGKCKYGYMITPTGVYDVLKDGRRIE